MKTSWKPLFWGGAAVLILAIVLAVFLSLRGNGKSALGEELFRQVFEANKSTDPARYLGNEAFGIPSASAEQKEALEACYLTVLNTLFPEDSWLRAQRLRILEQMENQAQDDNPRSLDLVCLDWKMDSMSLNGNTAEVTISWISCEKIIIKEEDADLYSSMFPLTKKAVKAELQQTDGIWKVVSYDIVNKQIGAEDEASRRSFASFEEAYAYSMEKTPQNTELQLEEN